MTSVWEVNAVAILDSSVKCVCVWSTKSYLCRPTVLPRTVTIRRRPAVRRKWIKFIQFEWADFLAAPHHAHLCSEHFSECDFANPMEYRMSKLTRCSGTLSKSCLKLIRLYPCGSLGQSISFVFGARLSWPFCSDSPEWRSRHTVTWFGRHGGAFGTTENAFFFFFFRAFITLRSQFHLHHRSQRALTEIVSKITPNLGLVL